MDDRVTTRSVGAAGRRPADREMAAARRQPLQERSQEKVQRILAVTARLLDEMPVEEITTTLITRAAGVSLSSLYRFFPDREAIFESIVIRQIEKLQALHAHTMAQAAVPSLEFSDRIIDMFAEFMRSEPGFKALWVSRALGPRLAGRFDALRQETRRLSMAFMERTQKGPVRPDMDVVMRVSAEMVDHVLKYALQQPAAEQPAIIAELKRVTRLAFHGRAE
jgi:AcrR family transcriptional regulator